MSTEEEINERKQMAHFVITERGLFGVWLHEDTAHDRAQDIEGVVVSVPIAKDCR